MITQFRHAGIVVTDLERALRFYRDELGFVIKKQMDESGPCLEKILALPAVRVTTVKMTAPDGGMIELLKFHSHPETRNELPRANQIGTSHIALTVKNLDQAYARLTSIGIQFNAPPQRSPDGMVKVTFCRDPDGTLIELVEML